MLNPEALLDNDILTNPKMAATREGFGKGVVEAGKSDERVVVLTADLAESTQADKFQKAFPDRFVQVGVAEQNLVTVASGMAVYGKIPFCTSYAAFNPGRNWEQIRTTIALNNVPVVVCGMHAGLLTGPDGATHQMLEDIAMMRTMPNMIVLSPCDAEEGRKATLAAAKCGKPVYMRFARDKTPQLTTTETPFEIGKAIVLWRTPVNSLQSTVDSKNKVTIFATGALTYKAVIAARELEKENIAVTVVNIHTIKPIDEETIVREAQASGAVVTYEEHQVHGGMGSAVAEVLARKCPVPMEFVGMQDKYGQSGNPEELIEHYEMSVKHIVVAAKKAIARATK